jgi:transposase-like protein
MPNFGGRCLRWFARAARPRSWLERSSRLHQSIHNWVKRANVDEGRDKSGALTTEERLELRDLRRENRILREEREILKKAAAWFAEETRSTPKRLSTQPAALLSDAAS